MFVKTLTASSQPPMAGSVAVALALLGAFQIAHAQSSYALTRLSEPFLGKVDVTGQIDSQNRVTATVGYLSGYRLFGNPIGPVYTWYVARWPASTAASVGPAKVISQPRSFDFQSQDGGRLFVSASSESHYDVARRAFVQLPSVMPAFSMWQPAAINDSGVIVGVAFGGSKDPAMGQTLHALRWAPGAAAPEVLPVGNGINRASAIAISRSGMIAGMVGVTGETDAWHAVLWRESGAMEILNGEPGTASTPIALNDAGDVLVKTERLTVDGDVPRFAVVSQGVTKAVEPARAGDRLTATDIGTGGVVLGTVTPSGTTDGAQDRAFIWQDGVANDLTAWVTARGVKLPAGAVLSAAWRINAQGSILASLRESNGKTSLVRLTARP